jgi:hypothetical protein
MLVHEFYLVECIGVEFKFELDSNRFELVGKKEKGRKQESWSVIPSILSHSFYSQSFLLFSVILSILSHSLSLTPPVGDHLLPFLLLLPASSPCSSSAVPAAPSLPVAPLRPQCARLRPTDQARRRPHLLEAKPQAREFANPLRDPLSPQGPRHARIG